MVVIRPDRDHRCTRAGCPVPWTTNGPSPTRG